MKKTKEKKKPKTIDEIWAEMESQYMRVCAIAERMKEVCKELEAIK